MLNYQKQRLLMLEERQIRKANRLENRVEQLKEVAQAAKENDRLPNEEVKRD